MKLKRIALDFGIAVAIAVSAYLLYILIKDLWPLVQEIIANRDDEEKTVSYLESYGLRAIPILLALEAVLAMIGVIPADPIHILAGLCYGVMLGSVIAVVGVAIGNSAIFLLFRKFHSVFGKLVKPKEKKAINLSRLEKMRHPEIVAAAAYVIPGMPNTVIPYVFSKLKISFWRYILAVTIGSIPGIVMMSFAGHQLAQGNWEIMIVIIVAVFLLLGVAFLNRKRLMKIL